MVSVCNEVVAVIRTDGVVHVWGGTNQYGEQNVPTDLRPVVQVSVGDGFVLAVQDDGTVRGWGRNDRGQTTPPEGLSNVVAVSAGRGYAFAVKEDGTLVGWGADVRTVPDDVQIKGVKAVACSGAKVVFLAPDASVTTTTHPDIA